MISELEADLLEKYAERKIYLVGDGYDVTADGFVSIKPCPTAEPLRYHNAYSVAACAAELLKADPDAEFSDASLAPTYLRPSQAERERLARLKEEN